MKKVCFVGPIRTATSWIYSNLFNTLHVRISHSKESFFWSKKRSQSEICNYFANNFSKNHKATILVDFVPTAFADYSHIPQILENFDVIVFTLRDPFGRFLSHYNHAINFSSTLFFPNPDTESFLTRNPSILYSSLYSTHISCWLDLSDSTTQFCLLPQPSLEPSFRSVFESFLVNVLKFSYNSMPAITYDPVGSRVFVRFKLATRLFIFLKRFFSFLPISLSYGSSINTFFRSVLYSERPDRKDPNSLSNFKPVFARDALLSIKLSACHELILGNKFIIQSFLES